ncbi:alpha/beta hydrolase [Halalkalibacter okhensis]|uniref:alpha/beta hydrolase n=1 Tax=Halalkalibacter okhensis TaxID=333138 RepID=UPI00068B736A|nr:alpha/beta hydrolase [Halalkalibacter okhensis]
MKENRILKSIVFVAITFALLLTLTVPTHAASVRGVEKIENIPYTAPVPQHTQGNLLDLYIPDVPGKNKLPLVIWTSGSAWMSDAGKSVPPDVVSHFTEKGYAVSGVSIRSNTQVQFPGQLHDIRAAIRWLRENADEYNIDPNRIAILGNSSGGWAAAIAATTSNIWQLEGETNVQTSSAVQAAVPFFPPVDLLVMNEQEYTIMDHYAPNAPGSILMGFPIQDHPELTRKTNPITYIDDNMPPMHIFHGYNDVIVPHGQSVLLYEALALAGNEVSFTSVPSAGHDHRQIIGASEYTVFHTNRGGQERIGVQPAPTWESVERFINKSLNRAR